MQHLRAGHGITEPNLGLVGTNDKWRRRRETRCACVAARSSSPRSVVGEAEPQRVPSALSGEGLRVIFCWGFSFRVLFLFNFLSWRGGYPRGVYSRLPGTEPSRPRAAAARCFLFFLNGVGFGRQAPTRPGPVSARRPCWCKVSRAGCSDRHVVCPRS